MVVVTRGTPGSRLPARQYAVCILLNTGRNEGPHARDTNARHIPKVRQWRRARKSQDSDMLLVRDRPQPN